MGLLFFEILICLLIAAVLGCLICRWLSRKPVEDNSGEWEARLRAKEEEIANLRARIRSLEGDLSACNDKVRSLSVVVPAPAPVALVSDATVSMPAFQENEEDAAGLPEVPPELPTWMPRATKDQRDDLQIIKGVGPFLEKKLNAFGIYTFWQVSHLNKDNIKELGNTFGSFPDRVEREKWAEQARELHEQFHAHRDTDSDTPKFSS